MAPIFEAAPAASFATMALQARMVRDEFVLPEAARGGMSRARAVELAEAWLTEHGPYSLSSLEAQHGASINLSAVRADPRALLVESPYEPSSEALPGYLRNVLGDYYLVIFKAGSLPVVSVGVAAEAVDVGIIDERLTFPSVFGNEFRPSGIPIGAAGAVPIAPEVAATLAATRSKGRVADVPRLVGLGARWYPNFAYWEVPTTTGVVVMKGDGTPADGISVEGVRLPYEGVGGRRMHTPRFRSMGTLRVKGGGR